MALTLAGNLTGASLPGAGEHAAPALPHPAAHFWTPSSLARLAAQQQHVQQHLSQQQQLPLPQQQQQQQAAQLLNTSQQLLPAPTQQQLPQPMPLQQCFLPDANIMPQRQTAPLKLHTIQTAPLPTAAATQPPHTAPCLPQQQPAAPVTATTTTQPSPTPLFKLPLLDENKVAVLCNNNPGVYLLDRLSILCSCVSCGRPTEMTPTEFERHSGMAASKKWRRSIKVDYTDDPNMTIGRWLEVNGYDNNKVKMPGGAETAAGGCGAGNKPLAAAAGGSRPGSHSSSSSSSHLHHHSSHHHHTREHLPKSNLGRQPSAAAAAAVVDRVDDVSKDEVADILLFLKSGRSAEPMDEDEEGAEEEQQEEEAGVSYEMGSQRGSQRQQQSSQQCSDDTLGPQADQRQQEQRGEGEVLQEQASGDQDDSSKRANRSRRAPSWLADTVDPERPDILPDQQHHLQQAHAAAVMAAAAAAAKQRGGGSSLPAMARVLEAVKVSQAAAAAGLPGPAGPCSSGSLKRRREEDRGTAGSAFLADAESREVSESMGNGDVAQRPLITTSQVTLPAGAGAGAGAGVVAQQAVAAQQARVPGRVVASGPGVAGPRVAQWRLLPGQERLLLTVKFGGATFSGVIGALEVDV